MQLERQDRGHLVDDSGVSLVHDLSHQSDDEAKHCGAAIELLVCKGEPELGLISHHHGAGNRAAGNSGGRSARVDVHKGGGTDRGEDGGGHEGVHVGVG